MRRAGMSPVTRPPSVSSFSRHRREPGMKDAEGRYVACNSATERFFVLPASAIIGKMDHEIFPAEITEVIRAEDRAAIAAGGPRVDHAWVTICGESRQVLLEDRKSTR